MANGNDVKVSKDVYVGPKEKKDGFQFAKYKGVEIPFSDKLKEGNDWVIKEDGDGRFGWRLDPKEKDPDKAKKEFHQGQDIGVKVGRDVHVLHDGRVTIKDSGSDGYGKHIIVDTGLLGIRKTLYAHLSGFNVKDKQDVKRGDLIGYTGNSGRSTGAHLHWEEYIYGVPVDPLKINKRMDWNYYNEMNR